MLPCTKGHHIYLGRTYQENKLKIMVTELNQFCNRKVYLYKNYIPAWGIKELVEIDILACYLQVKSRMAFIRKITSTSNVPPNIMVKVEVLYNKEKSIWRLRQLLSLSHTQLRQHCNKTAVLLKEYRQVWQTFNEMVWDANFCNVEKLKQETLEPSAKHESLLTLPQLVAEDTIENNFKTCQELGEIVQHNWRIGHDKNTFLVSLKSCMWKITPHVFCVEDDYPHGKPPTSFHFFNSGTPVLYWKDIKSFSAEEIVEYTVHTIEKMHYMFTNAEENSRLFDQMQDACARIFQEILHKNKTKWAVRNE